ncbi:tyrosine-type recombinase/integrase [Luteococcus sediminum]
MLAAGKASSNVNDFALVAMLGLHGPRICEACGTNVEGLGEEHGHRVRKVRGKGGKVVQTPLPPAVQRAVERAVDGRTCGPILRCSRGTRMDRHFATRRLRPLAKTAGVSTATMHPHMLRHNFVTTMLDAGVDQRDVQIAARHWDPRTTMDTTAPGTTSAGTPTTLWPPTWPPGPDPANALLCREHRGVGAHLPRGGHPVRGSSGARFNARECCTIPGVESVRPGP